MVSDMKSVMTKLISGTRLTLEADFVDFTMTIPSDQQLIYEIYSYFLLKSKHMFLRFVVDIKFYHWKG